MEKIIDKILNNKDNLNLDFVFHIKNEEQLKILIKILKKNNFKIQFNLFNEELEKWMLRIGREDKFNTCFRIRNQENDKCVASNPSIEHWRLYCKDIIEFENGEIIFNEGIYTKESAEIEADKIILDVKEGSGLKDTYIDKTKEQIVDILMHQ